MFENRAKNEVLLEMIQSLQTDTLLKIKFGNLKMDTTTLTKKTQSTEVLLEMVQTVTKLLEKRGRKSEGGYKQFN